jgi:hypothetical protein
MPDFLDALKRSYEKNTVQVYDDSRRNRFAPWAVRHKERVGGHESTVVLRDAVFHVNENSRRRQVSDGKRRVHAWVRGMWVNWIGDGVSYPQPGTRVEYDLLKGEFISIADHKPVKSAKTVIFSPDGEIWVWGYECE